MFGGAGRSTIALLATLRRGCVFRRGLVIFCYMNGRRGPAVRRETFTTATRARKRIIPRIRSSGMFGPPNIIVMGGYGAVANKVLNRFDV